MFSSVLDVHRQNEADERDCTDDADHAVGTYGCAKKPYFESLGLSHEIISISSDSTAEPNMRVHWLYLDGADNDIRRARKKRCNLNKLDERLGPPHSREKTADGGQTRSPCC